jgi:hypothetical protein
MGKMAKFDSRHIELLEFRGKCRAVHDYAARNAPIDDNDGGTLSLCRQDPAPSQVLSLCPITDHPIAGARV